MTLVLDHKDFAYLEPLIDECGLDKDQLLSALGLPETLFQPAHDAALRLTDWARILRRLIETTGDETCKGSARQIVVGTMPFLLSGLPNGARLEHVFQRLAKGYNIAHGGPFNSVDMTAKKLIYRIDDREFPYATERFRNQSNAFMESILFSLHALFEALTSTPLDRKILKVTTKRLAHNPSGAFLKHFGAPIEFDADCYSLHYDGRIADLAVRPVGEHDYLSIFDAANLNASKDPSEENTETWSDRVARLIEAGGGDQEAIAASLGISLATMRRRLASEKTRFRDLRAATLAERAKRLLQRGEAPKAVAETLGFSDLRSFSRAFKKWTGHTPTRFRLQTPHNT
ncbi:MAG: helix-turn-helix domain-containing protein [Pseudomonadota bacterium]